ncbi:hypothetical protein LOZ51_001322 [Ophidiomyces ophidiicola]|nr:hypothetical protein LOZ54_000852 [Ophidiomyces ophidiicola]KAI2001031.1 hypothetical protein LOZ51_001322 [Ophidiomyces ophidiicola]
MAYSNNNGINECLDELGIASPRSSLSESPFSSFPSPPAGRTSFHSPPGNDIRSTIQRRFTTDSTKFPSWAGIGAQPPALSESLDILSSFEKKRQHIEYMREQKKRFEADLQLLNLQQEKEEQEMDQIARDLARAGLNGPVSEPTTPPEYKESGFPTALSRPARFSISNGQSTPGRFGNIFSPQLTSPTSTKATSPFGLNNGESISSALNSRRNSEHEPASNGFGHYRPRHLSRYSLSTTTFQPSAHASTANNSGFGNHIGFGGLFASKNSVEEDTRAKEDERMSTPDVKSYLRMTDPDDKFPTLTRRDGDPNVLSANSAALDLANSRTPVPETYRPNFRHHAAHQSLPQNAFGWLHKDNANDKSQVHPAPALPNGPYHTRHMSRLSLENNYSNYPPPVAKNSPPNSRPVSLQMSYSASDVPTMRNGGFPTNITPPGSSTDHVINGGMIQPHPHQLNDTPPTPQSDHSDHIPSVQSLQSGFQANNPPFSSVGKPPATMSANVSGSVTPAKATFPPHHLYGYGMQHQWVTSPVQPNGTHGMPAAVHAPFAQPYAAYSRYLEGPARVNQVRRNGENDATAFSRFANVPLEQYRGELYGLCKDQHGCRYLQRKLEERIPENVQLIFLETHLHVVELMTDPFGNYLCQKLLEFSNDEQRTALINNAAPQLVSIALNQHGTRALQKMIEFISTPEQTQTVINALRDKVVDLVQDLNGNHVIQKCLNRLSAADAQFIYDAVGTSCIAVGTHRHGCCVLQRCIDHASGEQRAQLIAQITSNSYTLVQDPFGNYVVQYILDLAEPCFTEPLCQTFAGKVSMLSKQKFSSNVIEKCLRTAEFQSRRLLIQEMLPANELERMLRDSFANYVVQTAMDYADPETRLALIEAIRPILPAIRQTPHGRRIAGKIMSIDSQSRANGSISGQLTPNDENNLYHQANPFSAPTLSQFGPQFNTNAPESLSASSSMSLMTTGDSSIASLGSTAPTSDAGTTIYCPVPQPRANLLNNGINGGAQEFSLY